MQRPTLTSSLLAPQYVAITMTLLVSAGFSLFLAVSGRSLFESLLYQGYNEKPSFDYSAQAERISYFWFLITSVLSLLVGCLIAYHYHTEQRAFVRYQRWGRQKLEEMLVGGAESDELLRVKNRLIDAPDASGGYRKAFTHVSEILPERLRDDSNYVKI